MNEAVNTPVTELVDRALARMASGEWRLILEHPNPAEGTSICGAEVGIEIARLATTARAEANAGEPVTDRQMLLALNDEFRTAVHFCERCGEADPLNGFDCAFMLTNYLEAHPAPQPSGQTGCPNVNCTPDACPCYPTPQPSGPVKALAEALKPFAAIADEYADQEDDEFQVWKDFDVLGATLPLKHFRAAREALRILSALTAGKPNWGKDGLSPVWLQNLIGFLEGVFPDEATWRAIWLKHLRALTAGKPEQAVPSGWLHENPKFGKEITFNKDVAGLEEHRGWVKTPLYASPTAGGDDAE